MRKIEDYVDFAHSLIDMEEVKEGKFPLPAEITFTLSENVHLDLQFQIHKAKGLSKDDFEHTDTFTLSVLDIDFKFIKDGK